MIIVPTTPTPPPRPLTDVEKRLLAWQKMPRPCRYCHQVVGHVCVTASGAPTTSHRYRMDDLDLWLAGAADLTLREP